jgi:hypothetical protein
MSLREGNEEAASFRTRIPRPAPSEVPAEVPAAEAPAAEVPTTKTGLKLTVTRATAGDVKSAVAAAVSECNARTRRGGIHTRRSTHARVP